MAISANHHTAAYWEHAAVPAPELGGSITPGQILRGEFLAPLGVSINRMAGDLGIPYKHAHDLTTGKRSITPITALLLAKYLGTSPQFWLNLQTKYELEQLRGKVGERMARVRPLQRPDIDMGSARPNVVVSTQDTKPALGMNSRLIYD